MYWPGGRSTACSPTIEYDMRFGSSHVFLRQAPAARRHSSPLPLHTLCTNLGASRDRFILDVEYRVPLAGLTISRVSLASRLN